MAEKKDDRSPQQKAAATRTRNKQKQARDARTEARDDAPPVAGVDAKRRDVNAPSHERDRLVGQKTPQVVHDTGQNPQPRVNPGRPEVDNPDSLPEYHPQVQDARDEAVGRGPQAPTEEPEDANVFWNDSTRVDPRPVMPHHADTIAKDRARYDHDRPDLADHPATDNTPTETPALADPKFSPWKRKR